MKTPLKTIELHGILAKKFGRFFKLQVSSAKEATHAIACQIPAFKKFMADSDRLGYRFAVFNGKKRNQKTNIGENQLTDTTTASHIHIVPVIMGSGGKAGGWLQVIAGVVLVAVGFFTYGSTTAYGMALISAGIGLTMGGVSTLLMPSTSTVENNNDDGNRPNNGFGGAVTTVAQGNPVPILYGERDVGGFIVSAGIDT